MLGAIAGDIIGSRFEGEAGPPRDFTLFHSACRFTDDTVCSLAVADALLGARDFAASLRSFVRRHPRRGYGGMFLRWAFVDDKPAYRSWGNGAPMRAAAVGWLARDEAEARAWAEAQAAVTHNHPDAIVAAQAVALAILLARRGMPRAALRQRLGSTFGYDLVADRALVGNGFDVSAAGTTPPALAAALEADDWESAVRTAVCRGGDTDTLACITGAVAEAIHGLPHDIAAAARGYLTDDLRAVLTQFETAVRSQIS
ncbi:MAG: ADP-ribosylglycohydrolase family protein [Proteobacteria bacterium]|nr:ADP-ribosylglycohydrolase family protein [Pseudomonadota bacterium]